MLLLASQGWDVHLACSPEDGTDAFERLKGLSNVTLHPVPMARAPHPVTDARSLLAWWRLIRQVGPDLAVCSTPKAGLLGTLAARAAGVQTRIYHVRGLRAEGLRGPLRWISHASERLASSLATDVLVDSPSLLVAMRSRGLIEDGKGVVLGAGSCCGVDTHWFRPPTPRERQDARDAFSFSASDVVVTFVGRIAVDKGIKDLLEAAKSAHSTNERIRLLLVGPTEDASLGNEVLQSQRRETWISAPGATDDPKSVYWASDIFCLPSHREGFPIAPLEAQSCGVPVITTDATGCIDSIEVGITGLTVPAGDTLQLASAIVQVAGDQALRELMSSSARTRVIEEFDAPLVLNRVVNYLGSAVAKMS